MPQKNKEKNLTSHNATEKHHKSPSNHMRKGTQEKGGTRMNEGNSQRKDSPHSEKSESNAGERRKKEEEMDEESLDMEDGKKSRK